MTFVLAVDDDPAILRTLSINLRARGYDVETAGDGRSALQIVDERMPDVVILDLGLPDVDGVAVLRRLRSFTDVRLALASRLGIEEGDEAFWYELSDEDPRSQAHDIYEWVGYLQETLVDALMR